MALPRVIGAKAARLHMPVHSADGWRSQVPTLSTPRALLREIAPNDAESLASALGTPEVQQYLPIGPADAAGYAQFIRWVRGERRAGRYICFAVLPGAYPTAAGLFQIWPIEPGFATAEMGFALGRSLWGTGLFQECAAAVIDFAIDTLGVRRIECRSATDNVRGAAALRKLGAVPEGTLRECFLCPGGFLDHTMWALLAREWRKGRGTR
jgi:RimJ/RimL family protein N-acetyltransferase